MVRVEVSNFSVLNFCAHWIVSVTLTQCKQSSTEICGLIEAGDMACAATQSTEKRRDSVRRTRIFKLHLSTWNVAQQDPPYDFSDLLGFDGPHTPDAYAIGLQEVGGKMVGADSHPWTLRLTDVLSVRGYVRAKTIQMQGLLLVLFVRASHLLRLSNVESEWTRTGLGGMWGNKGGVSIRMDINGVNTCIVNCHLAAHLDGAPERIEDFFTIVEKQQFRDKDVDSLLDHDYVFWLGDLNFRIDDLSIEDVKDSIAKQEYSRLWDHDQLNKIRDEEVIFLDFDEGPLSFAPTYKFDRGTDTYDTSKKNRKPAWCDRILWAINEDAFDGVELDATQHFYRSHPAYTLSDHKPVTALFSFVVLAKPPPTPVVFLPVSRWYTAQKNVVTYRRRPETVLSSWDWVGLYKRNFRHFRDYVTYQWANADPYSTELTVKFPRQDLSSGKYRLCYMGSGDVLLGMSEEFELVP